LVAKTPLLSQTVCDYCDCLLTAAPAASFNPDSTPNGPINNIYGPFATTLQVPGPNFFAGRALWGNAYPLMCTDANPKGIDCDHWVLLHSPGSLDHGSWYSFRKDNENL